MRFEVVILESAGSLAVAILALLMTILQMLFFIQKPYFRWYAWSAAISFSALLYAFGIFVEYNTSQGPLNHLSGLLEWTALICLIHSLYGFTFSYLDIGSKNYHLIGGIFHALILILLWSTGLIVAESYNVTHFVGLSLPYIEPALGPLGPVFMLYAATAAVIAMIIWVRDKNASPKDRIIYLAGMSIWILLGIHDGLAALGVPTIQYFMEYGFLGFTIAVLWVVSSNFLELAAEDKYRAITEFANDCILIIQNEKLVFGNPACRELMGRSVSDWAIKDFLDLMPLEDQEKVLSNSRDLLNGCHVPEAYIIRIRNVNGEEQYVEITSSVIHYRDRPAVLSIARDITARTIVEKSLRESEEKYRSMMEAMSDPVYICTPDLKITYMNPAMIKMLGRDATGEACHRSIFDQDIPCPWCSWDVLHKDEISEREIINPEDNKSYHVTHSPIFHEDGTISHMIILKDITQTKQLRQQIFCSERLSATGKLAATIAHEINSPLQGIISLVNSIERSHAQDEQLSRKIRLVRRGFERIRDTVRRLLDLNRPGKDERQSTQVNRIIEDTLGLLKSYLLKNHVQVDLNLSNAIPNISASPQQLGHVVMNLITNAVEAIAAVNPSETAKPVEKRITVRSAIKDDVIVITFSDSGPGISEDDLEHVFDFFYTRKEKRGMGIGLSICRSIIESHDGSIVAANALEGGAVFTITLPTR